MKHWWELIGTPASGTPELKYSEETFRVMYEALLLAKGTLEALHIQPDDPRYLQIKQALAKADGGI